MQKYTKGCFLHIVNNDINENINNRVLIKRGKQVIIICFVFRYYLFLKLDNIQSADYNQNTTKRVISCLKMMYKSLSLFYLQKKYSIR